MCRAVGRWAPVVRFRSRLIVRETSLTRSRRRSSRALLYWQTFNIGSKTTLDFDQSAGGANVGDWVAINRILDPTINPTQILGAIEAPGQVYVINQNGIIFHGSSQINTHALVASTLPINTELVGSGFLNNPNGGFLFTSQADAATGYDPNNDTSQIVTSSGTITQANTKPNFASGSITVCPARSSSSPGSPEGVGGKIALIAPYIDNEGTIESDDGQVILAAGQQVGFVPHRRRIPACADWMWPSVLPILPRRLWRPEIRR